MAESPRSTGIHCVIVTPETTVLDITAKGVILPLDDGLRGIERGHAAFIGRLGAGEVRFTGAGPGTGTHSHAGVFIEGGFVEVAHDTVTVVTQRAIPVDNLDTEAARATLDRLRGERAVGDEAIAAKDRAITAARAILATARRPSR